MRVGNFAAFEKQVIADLYDPDVAYLTRWKLITTPWFAVYLHKIHLNDGDRDLHDHPWPFAGVVLRGGYIEERGNGTVITRRAGSFGVLRLGDIHSVRELLRQPTWTLIARGKDQDTWGFQTPDGWVEWREYVDQKRSEAASSDK